MSLAFAKGVLPRRSRLPLVIAITFVVAMAGICAGMPGALP